MTNYIIEHKHCRCTLTIEGENFYDACKRNNINTNLWKVVGEYNA